MVVASIIGICHAQGQLSPMNHVLSIIFLLVSTSLFFWLAIRLKKAKPEVKVSVKKEMISVGKYWLVFFISAFILSSIMMMFFHSKIK